VPTSGWWFVGRLTPLWETRFNVQEVPADPDDPNAQIRLEVYYDRIAVWSNPVSGVISGPEEASGLFALVVACYAVLTRIVLDVSLEQWLEVTDARFHGTKLGVVTGIVSEHGHEQPGMLPADDQRNVAMRAAAELAVRGRRHPYVRLMLRDTYAALRRDSGDDAFVYGYRALQDAARHVNGLTGEIGERHWRALADRLRVEPEELRARKDRLVKARNAASKGDVQSDELRRARETRDRLLDDARLLVTDVLIGDDEIQLRTDLVRRDQCP
jgi:hypothetical protein